VQNNHITSWKRCHTSLVFLWWSLRYAWPTHLCYSFQLVRPGNGTWRVCTT